MSRTRTKRHIFGNILMGICVLLACIAQASVFPYFKIFGAVPQLALVTLAIFASYANRELVCCYAVATGFILGCLSADQIMIYPITYLLAVCVSMAISELLNFIPILACLGSVFLACLCDGIMNCGSILYRFEDAGFFDVFLNSALPSLFYSLLMFLPIYLLCFIHKKLFSKGEHT